MGRPGGVWATAENQRRPRSLSNMPQRKDQPDCTCATLRERLAFNILLDEFAIAALSDALVLLNATDDDPGVTQIEHTIRTHRIAILKQRVILGAAGIELE